MDERLDCCRYRPSLDDLLADAVMEPVLRSAGLDHAGAARDDGGNYARRIEDRANRRQRQAVRSSRRQSTVQAASLGEFAAGRASSGRLSASDDRCRAWRRAIARTKLGGRGRISGVVRLGSRRTKRSNTRLDRSGLGDARCTLIRNVPRISVRVFGSEKDPQLRRSGRRQHISERCRADWPASVDSRCRSPRNRHQARPTAT